MSAHLGEDLSTALNVIRSSLQSCTETHGEKCDRSRFHLLRSHSSDSAPIVSSFGVVVLNVETLELQTISPEEDFIALSYVWGRRTIASTWTDTDSKDSNRIDIERLPRTLFDAIIICRFLEYQYIWIDQLCIDQQDPVALNSQIDQMHQIYASATATIVVACNTCADEGINCHVQTSGNPHSENWSDELQRSQWSRRAWTYQEMQLSRRLIIITSSGILFVCMKGYSKLPIWGLPSINNISCWSAYSTILTEYTSRQISYKDDTLNAITGIARTLARFTDDSFLGGIPAKQIWWGILWQPTESSTRQYQWPSWSWAGWTGEGQSMCPIFYPSYKQIQSNQDHDRNRAPQLFSSLKGLRFSVPHSNIRLIIENRTKLSSSPDRSLEHCDSGCESGCPLLMSLVSAPDKPFYDSGILNFTATILKLRIEPTKQRSPRCPQLYQCRLLQMNIWVGSMFVAADLLPVAEVIDAEFVVLTFFNTYLHEYEESVFGNMLSDSESKIAFFDNSFEEQARKETALRFEGWTNGRYHARHGWSGPRGGNSLRHRRNFADDDPHYGMPYPSEIHMNHVLWIERGEDLNQVYRKGIGIVANVSLVNGLQEDVALA